MRKHGFMANWAWLLLVCLAHNLCCWTQSLGELEAGRDGSDLRAKRLRYRFLVVPGLLVSSGRRLVLKLRSDYPFLERFILRSRGCKRSPHPPADRDCSVLRTKKVRRRMRRNHSDVHHLESLARRQHNVDRIGRHDDGENTYAPTNSYFSVAIDGFEQLISHAGETNNP